MRIRISMESHWKMNLCGICICTELLDLHGTFYVIGKFDSNRKLVSLGSFILTGNGILTPALPQGLLAAGLPELNGSIKKGEEFAAGFQA